MDGGPDVVSTNEDKAKIALSRRSKAFGTAE